MISRQTKLAGVGAVLSFTLAEAWARAVHYIRFREATSPDWHPQFVDYPTPIVVKIFAVLFLIFSALTVGSLIRDIYLRVANARP